MLEGEGPPRGSRRTQDGRTPVVRQEQLAAWFGMAQPHVSRLTRYWLEGDWANLLSLKADQVLTTELVQRIVEVFATFPRWEADEVYQYLREQGLPVSQGQVEQAAPGRVGGHLQQVAVYRYYCRNQASARAFLLALRAKGYHPRVVVTDLRRDYGTAHRFLGVFEKVHRFTPFSDDAQPRIRGKCPLELAGYDISQTPMATICAGLSVAWPVEILQTHVPNQ